MKRFIDLIEKNSITRLLIITSVFIGSIITIGNFIISAKSYVISNMFVSKEITSKISDLYAGQSINHFKRILGSELIQREVTKKYTEYVFEYKKAYIQTLVEKQNNEVVYWAITYCGKNPVIIKRPVFSMPMTYIGKDKAGNEITKNILKKDILLNKDSIKDFFIDEQGEFNYFIGNTANSFAFESLYLANPGAYQTVIIGTNDVCASGEDIFEYLDPVKSTNEQIANFRNNARVNTYAETSPLIGEEIISLLNSFNEPSLNFGVDRIKIRYFNTNQ